MVNQFLLGVVVFIPILTAICFIAWTTLSIKMLEQDVRKLKNEIKRLWN